MNDLSRPRTVAVLSFAFTYLLFCEYLPPFSRVHIPYDLDGFHYPRALGVALAIGASLRIAAVQFLHAIEATAMKALGARYGAGFRNPDCARERL